MEEGIKVFYFKTQDISGVDTEYAYCEIVELFEVDSYRGEDSGAAYSVFDTRTIGRYNIASVLDHLINNKTIRDLIIESDDWYPRKVKNVSICRTSSYITSSSCHI